MSRTKTCFVIQGFGEKTDYRTGRTLNLDASYEVIREAVEAAGLHCVRADEIQHSQIIDKPMYELILNADLVIADLSTSNINAAYELGVRHALRKHTTIIIAEDRWDFPFDINRNAIRTYEHLGPDLGRREANRFSTALTGAIVAIMGEEQTAAVDSPLYTFIPDLQPPLKQVLSGAGTPAIVADDAKDAGQAEVTGASIKGLMDAARTAMADDQFSIARGILQTALNIKPNDDYIAQQLVLATYKSGLPGPVEALLEAQQMMTNCLHPARSNDPETLGLWAAIHKRLWRLNKDPADLDEAICALERGFLIKNDYYTGINYAFMLNERAIIENIATDEAIADRVLARRVRSKVMAICEQAIKRGIETAQEKYWVLATLWESAVGLGDQAGIQHWQQQSERHIQQCKLPGWMISTTRDQVGQLRLLLRQ